MAYSPFWQEDPRQQQRGLFFSNAGLLNQGRGGGGGMGGGMTSTTTGEDPLGPPQEDPMTTAYKMKMMYEGGQKGKKYIGDAWKKGKEWLDEGGFTVADVTAAKTGGGPLSQTTKFVTDPLPQAQSVGTQVPSTGARLGVLPPQQVKEPMGLWDTLNDPYIAHPMNPTASLPGSASPDAIPWDVASEGYNASGVADFGNISADPLTSGTQSLDYAGLYPQPEFSGLSNMPGSLGSGGLFTPGTGALNASTGVFTPAGGQLMGDAVGAGSKFAGGGFANAPKGAGMGNALGALGSAAGVGMNIYDMFDQGVTPGNMMGMLGSGMLGASALGSMGVMSGATAGLGLANAWNPIGWALLGGSIAGSLFDWW